MPIEEGGRRVWREFDEIVHGGEDFGALGEAFEKHAGIFPRTVGNSQCRLFSQRQLVDFAVRWIEENRK